jgi:outer membrane protein assembly factor BamB
MDNGIYVLTSGGALSWSYETGDFVELSPAIDTNGKVYIGSMDKNLYALAPDGTLSWSYRYSYRIKSSVYNSICNQTASVVGNSLILRDNTFPYKTYTFVAGDPITGEIMITGDGYYRFTTSSGEIYVVDCEGGLVYWSPDGIIGIARAGSCTNDQLVYTSDDNNVYALEEGP